MCMLNDAILVVNELVWNPSWFRLTTGIICAQIKKFERFGTCFCTCALIIWSVLLQVAYKLQLPAEIRTIFLVFHVSQLKKCLRVPEERVDTQGLKIGSDLTYKEHPVRILDRKDRVTRNRVVMRYKVLWSNHDERNATWEIDAYLREVYKNFYNKWFVT
jgi:hypothetical protein